MFLCLTTSRAPYSTLLAEFLALEKTEWKLVGRKDALDRSLNNLSRFSGVNIERSFDELDYTQNTHTHKICPGHKQNVKVEFLGLW